MIHYTKLIFLAYMINSKTNMIATKQDKARNVQKK